MTNYATKNWDKRNCQMLASGQTVVRESLVPLAFAAQIICYGGDTVRNPRTGQVWHYLLKKVGANAMSVVIVDEDFTTIQTFSLPNLPAGMARYGFCVTTCGDELLITSPYFPSLWGLVGGCIQTAQKVASINALNTTAVDVPRGISVGWAGRAVVADVDALWFSDPLAPQTFVGQNAVAFPGGQIYGLHVNSGGALVICSEGGVFALSEQAAATGQIVIGIFQKLSDQPITNYETTAASQGRTYGLTEKDVEVIDQEDAQGVLLSENMVSRTLVPRIAFQDYRQGRIYPTALGHIVTIGGFSRMTETSPLFSTWWHSYDPQDPIDPNTKTYDCRGILQENDGEEIFVMGFGGILWRCGERDDLSISGTEQTYGSLASQVRLAPDNSPVVRAMYLLSDSRFGFSSTLQGITKATAAPVQASPVIGVDSWGSGFYKEPTVTNRRTQWSVRTRDPSPELIFRGWPSRVPDAVSIEFQGPGQRRP